jgi:hypothetical protein
VIGDLRSRDLLSEQAVSASPRPQVGGKFLWAGGEKLYVRGATYGAFEPNEDGIEYHDLE